LAKGIVARAFEQALGADVLNGAGEAAADRCSQFTFEAKIAFGGQQPLHERKGRGEQDPVAMPDEFVADGSYDVALASPGQSKDQQILAYDATSRRRLCARDIMTQQHRRTPRSRRSGCNQGRWLRNRID
jgi:hypothetical protein